MKHLIAVVLAAGEGKRMKSKKSKVVHKVSGKPVIECPSNSILPGCYYYLTHLRTSKDLL